MVVVSMTKLTCSILISFTGNAGSAIVELLVGSSMWPVGKNFITLLPSTMLMSPTDSKAGKNMEAVKMLDRGLVYFSVILHKKLIKFKFYIRIKVFSARM